MALVTDDFRLYHQLAPFFESYGITVLGLSPKETPPPSVRVLVNGPASDPRTIPLRSDPEATLLATFSALDPRPNKRDGYARIVFGVDPGQVLGLAVLADGETMLTREALSVGAAVERLCAWATGLKARVWAVHVGDGHPETGRALMDQLAPCLPQARISLVGEEGTSPWFAVTGSRHTDAAILIAMREPQPV